MYPKGVEEKLVRWMCERHTTRFGPSVHDLGKSDLSILTTEPEADIPEIVAISGNMKKPFLIPAAKELERRGLVEFNDDNTRFWLTPNGFAHGSKGVARRSLDFFNVNAGLATVIAILSLVVSIIALVVSVSQRAP